MSKRRRKALRHKAALRVFLADQQSQRCARCGLPLIGKTEIDHFIPKARGGKDRMSNYRLLHASCNRDKADALE